MAMSVDHWTLGDFSTMDASVWSYQENIEDLKYKLQYASMELEAYRKNTKKELSKREETINQLLQLVEAVTKERDEAKQQVQLILQQLKQPNFAENFEVPSQLKPDTPQLRQVRAGSGVSESENMSGSPNPPHSYGSSPVESFFDPVNSPEFSSMNMADCCNISQQQQPQQAKIQENKVIISNAGEPDPASSLIDSLVPKRPLPAKGNLVQSVLDAGPLLQTIMLAGPLPEWRNPPPLQAFHIPPLITKPLEINVTAAPNPNNQTHMSNCLPHVHAVPSISHPVPTGVLPPKRCTNASLVMGHVDASKRLRSD